MHIDQNTDTTFKVLKQIVTDYPTLSTYIKTAQVGEHVRNSLPDSAFADRSNRLFPVHSPADAILSKAYTTKLANVAPAVVQQIDDALDLYGVDRTYFERAKVAHHVEQERPIHLIPSQRKLPVYSNTSTKVAEDAFIRNKKKLSSESLAIGASRLVKIAEQRKEDLSVETLKLAGLTQCDTSVAADWIEARATVTKSNVSESFYKLASIVRKLPSEAGRSELLKVASTLDKLDKIGGLDIYYNKKLMNPLETIFNTKVAMEKIVDLAGSSVPLNKLLEVDPKVYGDILGSDIVDEIAPGGQLDPEALVEILDTLPVDMKKSLVQKLGM